MFNTKTKKHIMHTKYYLKDLFTEQEVTTKVKAPCMQSGKRLFIIKNTHRFHVRVLNDSSCRNSYRDKIRSLTFLTDNFNRLHESLIVHFFNGCDRRILQIFPIS